MITNERQYRITKAQAERFARALARVDEEYGREDPVLRQAMYGQIESQLSDLRAELAEYDRIRTAGGSTLDLGSIEQYPDALVWGRIARGLTQRELGKLMGVSEQQVQRDESSGYSRASFQRMMEVARALGMHAAARVTLPSTSSEVVGGTTAELESRMGEQTQGTASVVQETGIVTESMKGTTGSGQY